MYKGQDGDTAASMAQYGQEAEGGESTSGRYRSITQGAVGTCTKENVSQGCLMNVIVRECCLLLSCVLCCPLYASDAADDEDSLDFGAWLLS